MPHERYNAILVVNPYGIGDVLFATPLLHTLRANFPRAYIAALVGSRTRDILRYNPDVNEIFVFDKGRFDSGPKLKGISRALALINELKAKRFDLFIDLSNVPEYAFLAKFFLKIRRRVGFNYRGRGRFLTDKIGLLGFNEKHIVEYYLDTARYLGLDIKEKDLRLTPGEDEKRWADEFLRDNKLTASDKLIAAVPGGGTSWGRNAQYKQWPPEDFARALDILIGKSGAKVILFGAEEEIPLCRNVGRIMRNAVYNLSGATTILEFAALAAKCSLLIANDGGPLHIGVSQGVPTVAIFGPVDPAVYGAYLPSEKHITLVADLDCRPCYRNFKFSPCDTKECLLKITPEEVVSKITL